MRSKLITGALAMASLWGWTALAEGHDVSPTSDRPYEQKSTDVTATPSPVSEDSYIAMHPSGPQMDVIAREPSAKPPVTKDSEMRGLSVMLGGGVEGYSGQLAPRLQAGPSWGVTAVLRPSKVFGVELGYSGATNEIEIGGNGRYDAGVVRGPDIVRNGGSALATFGLTAAPVQPYVAAGVGIDWYSVRAEGNGFRDDTSASIPVGVGVRTYLGRFTADARLGYSWLINSDFATFTTDRSLLGLRAEDTARFQGTLSLGSTF